MNLKGAFRYIRSVIFGYYYAREIIHQYPQSTVLIGYAGIGDRVFMLSYVNAFKTENNIKNVKIISSDPNNIIYKYFGIQDSDLIRMSYKKMTIINEFFTTDWGYRFQMRDKRFLPVSIDPYVRRTLFDFNDYILHSDIIKQIYRIPLDTIPKKFKYNSMSAISQKYFSDNEFEIGKTILINPYANSCKGIPLFFFQVIADAINTMGYKVITSLNNNQVALENTYGFKFPLSDALDLCSKCGIVIGARSGFMDLITYSEAKIICIDNVDYPHCSLFLLEECWKQNSNIKTFHWNRNSQNVLLEQILLTIKDYLGERNVASNSFGES